MKLSRKLGFLCEDDTLRKARDRYQPEMIPRLAHSPMLSYRSKMKDVTSNNFGVLIAYLVPGATALWGLSSFSPSMRAWFASTPADAPTISGFLYLTVASLAVGMTVTAIRWACVDLVHSATGLNG